MDQLTDRHCNPLNHASMAKKSQRLITQQFPHFTESHRSMTSKRVRASAGAFFPLTQLNLQRHQRWIHIQSVCAALHQNPAEAQFNQVIFHISHSQTIKKRCVNANCSEAEPHPHPHPLFPCVLHPLPL